ncbi:MAG: DUF177 domain-containing protein [Gammaproteobacteria bacterium]|nr:MAG: DUF177 domain-containing protein [Gammaproteobacteria bacterium]
MPAWSRPLEVERLADGGADVDFTVPLGELSGLRSARAGVAGSVHGSAHFGREAGVAVAELTLSGTATLVCQRCMGPIELPVRSVVRVALVGSEEEVGRVPGDLEPMLAPGGRISIGELVTEEMLLGLPIVALHGDDVGCGAASLTAGAPGRAAEATHRPFARLAELLKR